ncbi:hypothetical protein ACROYT_G025047 [Oculina patagonica]
MVRERLWVGQKETNAYINVARYQPLRGGTYLPLPPKLANKKAIINVQNRDNQCLKWALRAALFPPRDGKNPQRTSRYPVDDGINYNGIDFPTPLKQIDRLEAQNRDLAINVLGWDSEDKCVIPLRLSEKENSIPRIFLMLIESGLTQHYCFIKRVLQEKTCSKSTKNIAMALKAGQQGEMPEKGKNTLSFKNYQKQMKAPYTIYADFEALLRPIEGCKRETPEERQIRKDLGEEVKDMKPSYTDKTEQHEACGFAYTVVRSDVNSKISKEAQKEVKCVANNMEKYITFSLGKLRFTDSLNFLKGSLDSLVKAMPKEELNITKSNSTQSSDESFELLCKKGIYPYEYMDSWERFSETSLPEKEKFYSKLNDENITDKEYEHAQNVGKPLAARPWATTTICTLRLT